MTAPLVALQTGPDTFPVADCEHCGRRSLTWVDFDDAGEELLRCLSCDTPVRDPQAKVSKRAAERLGYVFLDARRLNPRVKGRCGVNGVRSCGSGGCSSGKCSSGGCGTGGC